MKKPHGRITNRFDVEVSGAFREDDYFSRMAGEDMVQCDWPYDLIACEINFNRD